MTDMDNNRLQLFNGNGDFIAAWYTWLPSGEHFSTPASVAVDRRGNIFVADYGSSRVLEFRNPYSPANTSAWSCCCCLSKDQVRGC